MAIAPNPRDRGTVQHPLPDIRQDVVDNPERGEVRYGIGIASDLFARHIARRISAMAATPWDGFRSVLCPIDFSEQSRLALRRAEVVALRSNAQLRVLYVTEPLLAAAAAAALNDRGLAERSAHELRQFVSATLSPQSRKKLRLATDVTVGPPSQEILKTAARSGADLIVMGTQGLTGPGRWFIGSTTLSVLQRTRIPVLVVPPNGDGVPLVRRGRKRQSAG